MGCAIFGITEVPTDGVEFDTGDFAGDTSSEPAAPLGTNYAPPATNEESSTELEPFGDEIPPPVAQATESDVVDLLDDQERGQATGTIDELD